jgi:hypothetical protein
MSDEVHVQRAGGGFSWIQVVAVVAVVVVFGFVVVRFVKKDAVSHWEVVAACATSTAVPAARVSTSVDTSICTGPPPEVGQLRGWPIVTFVLPVGAGLDPRITRVTADDKSRTVTIGYDTASTSADVSPGERVLVFIEVPPDSLPATPFDLTDAAGTTTVESVPVN